MLPPCHLRPPPGGCAANHAARDRFRRLFEGAAEKSGVDGRAAAPGAAVVGQVVVDDRGRVDRPLPRRAALTAYSTMRDPTGLGRVKGA
ncbi:hypothetical protein ACFWFZ_02370 [Streptomyces sp. NPDC060232]|uniref:hypothetical protein n=1 Tax=Streptomyces sp. NPDC060232 TaxID=3347079 RepID=UPI003661FC0F